MLFGKLFIHAGRLTPIEQKVVTLFFNGLLFKIIMETLPSTGGEGVLPTKHF